MFLAGEPRCYNYAVSDAAQTCLEERFALHAFRPAQREVIDAVLAGRDVLCVMPTGAGKSLCYQLPAVLQGGICVVVSPLISLMEDQVTQLRAKGIDACFINSSLSPQARRETINQLAAGFSGLIYLAPERLATGELDAVLNQLGVNLLAIDEAHCISQWGHDFRPEYSQIGTFRERLGNPPTIALTATATEDVRTDIIRLLHLREPDIVVTGFDRTNLLYEVRRPETGKDRDRQVERILTDQAGTGIVYCSTRKGVEEVAAWLGEKFKGRVIVPYHAGMNMNDRTWAQEQFMKTAGSVVVATSAFGMGINKPDVRFVVHYNMPGTIEQYYQEAGRAGRDGALSRCVMFYRAQDRATQQFFIDQIGKDNFDADIRRIRELKEHAQQKLDLMVRYATGHQCRRQMILAYFGDDTEVSDCECDVCRRGTAIDLDAPIPESTVLLVRQLLSGIARVNGKFGIKAAAELLGGVESERAIKFRFHELPTFGLLKVRSLKEISRMLERLSEAGLARQVRMQDSFGMLVELTSTGVAVMRGQAKPPGLLADLEGVRVDPARHRDRQSVADDAELDVYAKERFEKLRAARSRLAKEKEVPAYVVCHDKTLRAIAMRVPQSLEELETIKGMGSMKAAMYGPAFLEALA